MPTRSATIAPKYTADAGRRAAMMPGEVTDVFDGQVKLTPVVVGQSVQGGLQGVHAATSSFRSTSCPLRKMAPARPRATGWGALTARHRCCADSMSLNALARPAARLPGPLVTRVRCRTVAKVDSIGLEVRRRIQCSAGKS